MSAQAPAAKGLAVAPQQAGRVAKPFQAKIIASMLGELQADPAPPCLLRSPTGSGKTYMLCQVLAKLCDQQPMLWLWFVPYVNLVAQTVDALDAEGESLRPEELQKGLNEAPLSGLVLISTVQGVASAADRAAGYGGKQDDSQRSMAAYMENARAKGLAVGCVVDEAHIALKSTTEFGQFVRWLKPNVLLMASATPKDTKLDQFLGHAGFSGQLSFNVSREDVVRERLNKRFVKGVVLNLGGNLQGVTDLGLTALRQGWLRNERTKAQLRQLGCHTTPLLLVQVANGQGLVEQTVRYMQEELQVPAHALRWHTADEPDPGMMASVAADSSIEVLVFKQSAGTGFDAPRAFVFVSTKPVNDPDFATQFIGRVMRVPQELQQKYPYSNAVPPELDTAWLYLTDSKSQSGFEQAAQSIAALKSDMETMVGELQGRKLRSGHVLLSNADTPQVPVGFDLDMLPTVAPNGQTLPPLVDYTDDQYADNQNSGAVEFNLNSIGVDAVRRSAAQSQLPVGGMHDLFADGLVEEFAPGDASPAHAQPKAQADLLADLLEQEAQINGVAKPTPTMQPPKNRAEASQAYAQRGIALLPSKVAALNMPSALKREVKLAMDMPERHVELAAQQLTLEPELVQVAVKVAFERMTEQEMVTELFSGVQSTELVEIVVNQDLLDDLAKARAEDELGLEEDGYVRLVEALRLKLAFDMERAWDLQPLAQRQDGTDLKRRGRTAARWVLLRRSGELGRLLNAIDVTQAREADARPLPDALLIPAQIKLLPSAKGSYGVYFPPAGSIAPLVEQLKGQLGRSMDANLWKLGDGLLDVAPVDSGYEFNPDELELAKALDKAPFVQWWHRNPPRKSFSVALLRSDTAAEFFPDFVVCMEHTLGDPPLMRLIDPKYDVNDARNKAQHVSRFYGRVLFLSKQHGHYRIVNEDGTQGSIVDYDDLGGLKRWMAELRPLGQ